MSSLACWLLVPFAATPSFGQDAAPAAVGVRRVARLVPAELGPGDAFGRTVLLRGDTLLAGAEGFRPASSPEGAVFVYERGPDGVRARSARIDPPAFGLSSYQARFGSAFDLEGDLLAVGAPGLAGGMGGVALLERDPLDRTQWSLVRTIAGTTEDGWLGQSIALRGDVLVAGAPDGCFNTLSGCWPAEETRFYRRDAGGPDNWGEIATIPSPAGQCDGFGASAVAGLAPFFLVGAPSWDQVCNPKPPSTVHAFALEGGAPVPVGQVLPVPSEPRSEFGRALAIGEGLLAIGFHRGAAGAVSVLAVEGTSFVPLVELSGDPASPARGFGRSVAVGRDVIAVGQPFSSTSQASTSSGRVWVHARHQGGPNAWGLVQAVEPDDGKNGDRFGESVAIEGRTLVVGATERNLQPGSPGGTGALYVYELPPIGHPTRRGELVPR